MLTPERPTDTQRMAAARRLLAIAHGEAVVEGHDAEEFADYASATIGDGLDLQLEVLGLRRATGESVGGWKISPARSAPDARAFGYILASRVLRSGAAIDARRIRGCALEPELALTVGRRLAGAISPDEARAAVTAVAPAFEICSFRLPAGPALGRAVRVGDAMSNWGLLLGEERDPGVDLAAISVRVERDGRLIGESGPRADLHDGAFEALANAVRMLGDRGEAIEAGQHVILGSMLPPIPVDGARGLSADYGSLGRIELATALG
ncbi:MAG: 2-keto-4-pentenoate hydratase [Pseudonocardiales bacterium]|nr:2-keto-4-pentenoate hydratase [Pseudonocardiales bacterium]